MFLPFAVAHSTSASRRTTESNCPNSTSRVLPLHSVMMLWRNVSSLAATTGSIVEVIGSRSLTSTSAQGNWKRISSAPGTSRDSKPAEQAVSRSEEHTSELQSRRDLVCRLLLEKKKKNKIK